MSTFRELYESGELTREEFDRIRNKLTGRLQQELEAKPPADESAKPTPSDGPQKGENPPGSPTTPN
jgi:hypothetical protein